MAVLGLGLGAPHSRPEGRCSPAPTYSWETCGPVPHRVDSVPCDALQLCGRGSHTGTLLPVCWDLQGLHLGGDAVDRALETSPGQGSGVHRQARPPIHGGRGCWAHRSLAIGPDGPNFQAGDGKQCLAPAVTHVPCPSTEVASPGGLKQEGGRGGGSASRPRQAVLCQLGSTCARSVHRCVRLCTRV